ncbi:ABC transporter permease [Heyndrickxia camelliae]|uniref:Cell division protein FtsX n=1 Tax=Heyndrickxia camelliae TaxID=1707093 RepID=A0A2N3LNX8_9BACI|nr:ABC transporter permease [Heyndrickxia camelliae]PKR86331.1 cell division protein FtsX [Heyndrickxia camelliae]
MNIVNKLTLRHMRLNKRRTLVTIIGVIISVAMITAVATLFVSFMDLMKRQEIADNGEWHVLYKDVNKKQLEAIEKDDATKKVVLTRDEGYAPLKGGQNKSKPYLFIKQYSAQGFKQFPIELEKGRLPKAANEVVLSDRISTDGKVNFNIGDSITLNIGEREMKLAGQPVKKFGQNDPLQIEDEKLTETFKKLTTKTYTVVGFINLPNWEPTWAPGYTVIGYIDKSMIGASNKADAAVVLKKVNGSLYSHAEELAKQENIKSVKFNNALLRYYGVTNDLGLKRTLFSLTAVIMGVIIIGSVSLIYNAFAISVSERSRHLGMLSSVGATRRQKQNSVFFEGFIIGLISIPLGIIFGLTGIGVTFLFINSVVQNALGLDVNWRLTVTPFSILIACIVSMATILISTYLPARKASKISAIDAIRQTTDIKLTSKRVKTSKFVRKIFGFEAEVGLKNLKRNKRRYQATVFSLVISIVLFLAVSFFNANLKKSLVLSQDNISFDIQVSVDGEITKSDKDIFKTIAQLGDVTDASEMRSIDSSAWIDKDSIAKELKTKDYHDQMRDEKFPYNIMVHELDEQHLKAYAKSIGADYGKLNNPKHVAGIVIDTISYEDMQAKKYVETKAIHAKAGQSIDLSLIDPNTEKTERFGEVTFAALTEQLPMGLSSSGPGNLDIIVSKQGMNQLLKKYPTDDIHSFLYLKSKDPIKTQEEIEKIKPGNMYVYNVFQGRQQEEQMLLLMSVFTYGFIALMTAISVANILNTITTSISLRKREFAMLKSIGMTPKGFNKMIHYESIFYGIKSLLYGLPISIVVMYLIYRSLMNSFSFGFSLPWLEIVYAILAVFIIVSIAMLYSSSKVKKENIIDTLKQESI